MMEKVNYVIERVFGNSNSNENEEKEMCVMGNNANGLGSFGSGMETVANLTKIAANLTEKTNRKQTPPPEKRTPQPATNQTVEVKISEPNASKQDAPKKTETHIHKEFPEGRALTSEECAVRMKMTEMEMEDREKEREFRRWLNESYINDRRNERDYSRRRIEEKERRERRVGTGLLIAGGLLTAAGVAGYIYYNRANSRYANPTGLGLPASQGCMTPGYVSKPRHRQQKNQAINKPAKPKVAIQVKGEVK